MLGSIRLRGLLKMRPSPYRHLLYRQGIVSGFYQQKRSFVPNEVVKPRRLPLRTIALLVATTSSFTIVLYALIELSNPQKGTRGSQVFLPLWVNTNWIKPSRYTFPNALRYFDEELWDQFERKPLNTNEFQDVNVKYEILEKLARNTIIREEFGLPLDMEPQNEKFLIWIESKNPCISGVRICYHERSLSESGCWIKPIDTQSIKENTSQHILEHMERAPPSEIHSLNTTNKEYNIRFTGSMLIKGRTRGTGTVSYEGYLDLNHLAINNGVKISSLFIRTNQGGTKRII